MPNYIVISKVQVQQIPTDKYPNRTLLLEFSFMHRYEAHSTWEDLTQTLSLTLPKNVKVKGYVTTAPFEMIPQSPPVYVQLGNVSGQNSNLGGFTPDTPPTFLRGDRIRMNVGYRAIVNGGQATYRTGENGIPNLFEGFISLVGPKFPFTLECEDNMWLCKQVPTPAKNWGNVTLQKIVGDVLAAAKSLPNFSKYGLNLTVSDFSATDLQFNVNNFTTTRGSLAMLLARIKSQYRIDSYFRGNELRVGYLHYVPDDNKVHKFTFQKNILDNDNLKWQRRDDAVLSMIVRSNYLVDKSGVTVDGVTKTTHASTEILIYNNAGTFTYIKKEKGKDFPTRYLNDIGERFTMNIFAAIADAKRLFEIGKPQLQKYYYDGFKGSFTTMGIPYVKHGDTVELVNKRLPEQSGLYKVKAVRYYGGYDDGLKQEIFLDYKITE